MMDLRTLVSLMAYLEKIWTRGVKILMVELLKQFTEENINVLGFSLNKNTVGFFITFHLFVFLISGVKSSLASLLKDGSKKNQVNIKKCIYWLVGMSIYNFILVLLGGFIFINIKYNNMTWGFFLLISHYAYEALAFVVVSIFIYRVKSSGEANKSIQIELLNYKNVPDV